MAETELKLLIDRETAGAIWDRARAAGMTAARPRPRLLHSVYCDTPDHALSAERIVLRIRKDGRRWLQTVKAKSSLSGGLSRSGEWEAPAPGGRIDIGLIEDDAMRDRVAGLIAGRPVAPVCETKIRRQAGVVELSGVRAELAVDLGEIVAGARAAPFAELEIELLEGRLSGLYDIAQALLPVGGVRFSEISKAQRGYMLAAEGRIAAPLTPRKARAVPLVRGMTVEQAAREVLRECQEQIARNVVVVLAMDDPEGPHQLRVGLRRLRSAFSVFRLALRSAEMTRLAAAARDLGRMVGALRDLDVAQDIVARHAEAHPDEPGFIVLRQALSARAAEARARLRDVLVGREAQAFQFALARFIEGRGWLEPEDPGQSARLAKPVEKLAKPALNKGWKAAAKRARRIEGMTVEQRHDLRKALKRLRYAGEFLAPVFEAQEPRKFQKKLKSLLKIFGDLNDMSMVEALFTGEEAVGGDHAAARRAVGRILGAGAAHAEQSRGRAAAKWRALKGGRPFWK